MSRLSRSELKSIVKECLVEILSEGLSSDDNSNNLQETFQRSKRNTSKMSGKRSLSNIDSGTAKSQGRSTKKPSYLDSISFGENNISEEKSKPGLNTNITSDPILNELLADTALSTLQEQATAERGRGMVTPTRGSDQAAMVASQNNPEDLFGDEAASKWATLAFS